MHSHEGYIPEYQLDYLRLAIEGPMSDITFPRVAMFKDHLESECFKISSAKCGILVFRNEWFQSKNGQSFTHLVVEKKEDDNINPNEVNTLYVEDGYPWYVAKVEVFENRIVFEDEEVRSDYGVVFTNAISGERLCISTGAKTILVSLTKSSGKIEQIIEGDNVRWFAEHKA